MEDQWTEISKVEAEFSFPIFWQFMEQYVTTPHFVYKRIAYADVQQIEEMKSSELVNYDKTYKRTLYSKVPTWEYPINDIVTLDYASRTVQFEPSVTETLKEKKLEVLEKIKMRNNNKENSSNNNDKESELNNNNNTTNSETELSLDMNNPQNWIPHHYPKVKKYRIQYLESTSETKGLMIASAVLYTEEYKTSMACICDTVLRTIAKRGKREQLEGPYQKKYHHDVIVPNEFFYETYHKLKDKYRFWVDVWPEKTDPQKYVFEELSIAAFLVCLFQLEQKELNLTSPQSFVDLGCGNGFLVNILTNEGFPGKGVDITPRKIWSEYAKYGKEPTLVAQSLNPEKESFPDTDWLIGNHSDELTPWIPFMASRTPNTRYFVLPCCFFDFTEKYKKTVDPKVGRYHSYVKYIKTIGTQCGFKVEQEVLRIPSTKNISLIGRYRSYDVSDSAAAENIDKQRQSLLIGYTGQFKPRISDHEKTKSQKERKLAKAEKKKRQREEYFEKLKQQTQNDNTTESIDVKKPKNET